MTESAIGGFSGGAFVPALSAYVYLNIVQLVPAGLATTSSKHRYALESAFGRLFDPDLQGEVLATAVASWQEHYLSAGSLARVRLRGRAAAASLVP
jgi:hypothetical protein